MPLTRALRQSKKNRAFLFDVYPHSGCPENRVYIIGNALFFILCRFFGMRPCGLWNRTNSGYPLIVRKKLTPKDFPAHLRPLPYQFLRQQFFIFPQDGAVEHDLCFRVKDREMDAVLPAVGIAEGEVCHERRQGRGIQKGGKGIVLILQDEFRLAQLFFHDTVHYTYRRLGEQVGQAFHGGAKLK